MNYKKLIMPDDANHRVAMNYILSVAPDIKATFDIDNYIGFELI
jgi:hypothetical protein